MQFFNKYFLEDFYDEKFEKYFFMKILENFMMKFLIFFIIKLLIFYWDFLRGTVEGRMSKMRKKLLEIGKRRVDPSKKTCEAFGGWNMS